MQGRASWLLHIRASCPQHLLAQVSLGAARQFSRGRTAQFCSRSLCTSRRWCSTKAPLSAPPSSSLRCFSPKVAAPPAADPSHSRLCASPAATTKHFREITGEVEDANGGDRDSFTEYDPSTADEEAFSAGADEEEEDNNGDDDSSSSTSSLGVAAPAAGAGLDRAQKRLLREAEESLHTEELLSAKYWHRYVYITEVSTPSGVRWVDVRAKPALWENRILARQPETAFVAHVVKALEGNPMPPDVFSSVQASGALPSAQIHENWVCLTLRVAKAQSRRADPSYSTRTAATPSAAPFTSGEGVVEDADPASLPRRRRSPRRQQKRRGTLASAGAHTTGSAVADDGDGDPEFDDPASRYYYDEDKNQFVLLPDGARNGENLSFFSWILPRYRGLKREGGSFALHARRRRNSYSSTKAPTISEDTHRLSMFLVKEVHPMEEEKRGAPMSSDKKTTATKIGYVEVDEHGNRVFSVTKYEKGKEARSAGEAPVAEKRKKEETLPPPIKGAKTDRERQLRLRWVLVTVHREPISFVEGTLRRWQEFIAHGGRLLSDDDSDLMQRSFANGMEVGWEDIVRHLFHEAVREVQKASVSQTRSLEVLETEVFDGSTRSAEHMRRMRSMLRELHLLSRRASMYTDILRESKIAYKKLKMTVDLPLTASDRKALSFLESAISISQSLEDQSASLLFLQFSVAMNQMERHLRTLTIFSTFFTPLNFIVSYFSMHFDPLERFCREENTVFLFFGLMIAAALTTSRWISHNVGTADAFPFAPTSGVTELTPASLPVFVNTHKPVVILFYAPWCGHCKHFHPEYERFAQSVKGAVRVGAINADQYSDVGGQFGVRGFPTIKYWRMGSKSLAAPEEYQSHRTASALQQFMMAGVTSEKVRTNVKTSESLRQLVLAAPRQKAAVLFSAKSKVPPIFSILAASPKLQELPFVFVEDRDGGSGVGAAFGITALPTIAVLERQAGDTDSNVVAVKYSGGGVAYEPVAKFFLAVLEGTQPDSPASTMAAAAVRNLDGEHGDPTATAAGAAPLKKTRKALPVNPVAFEVQETLAEFCAPADEVTKLNGGVAWCVVTLSNRVDLAKVHAVYQHEPFLFFDASEVGAAALDASLQTHLNGLTLANCGVDVTANANDGVVLLRKTKPGFLRVVGFTGVDSTESLESVMEKVSGGAAQTKQWPL